MALRDRFARAIDFWETYERHLSAGALVLGFAFDVLIADRPDSVSNNLYLLAVLLLAGGLIILLNRREMRRKEASHSAEPLFLLLLLQFCFGGLASNMLVLYGHSGTLAGSALFIAILAGMLVGNEFLKTRYAQLQFNVGVFYLLLLSYCIIAVPTFLMHRIGTWVFLLSGLISIICIGLFLTVLFVVVLRGRDTQKLRSVSWLVGAIFFAFNLFYFLNIIPPVPLSLKDIGIYHSVLRRASGDYIALYEKPKWYELWRSTGSVYAAGPADSVTCYSSVFAPSDLSAPVYHRWEKYDPEGGWQTQSRVSFAIAGGRDQGYRGFSIKSALSPGKWRCNVETASGALIGRIGFTVVPASTTPALSQRTL